MDEKSRMFNALVNKFFPGFKSYIRSNNTLEQLIDRLIATRRKVVVLRNSNTGKYTLLTGKFATNSKMYRHFDAMARIPEGETWEQAAVKGIGRERGSRKAILACALRREKMEHGLNPWSKTTILHRR